MMDWELEKWTQEIAGVIKHLEWDENHQEDMSHWDACPSNIREALENLGWVEAEDMEDNGWQHDTWYTFAHPNHDFQLTFYYCGYTFEMKLYRKQFD